MKIKIPSTVKPLKEYKRVAKENDKTIQARNLQSTMNRPFYRYAHAHRRPLGKMKYDQKAFLPHKHPNPSINQQSFKINNICYHCHQPIY